MKELEVPKFDLPTDFFATEEIPVALLQEYSHFPCKIKACLFVLCTQGEVQASVNLSKQTIRQGSFVTILPGSFIQLNKISDDIHLYVAGFSRRFIGQSDFLKHIVPYFHLILQHAVLTLPPRIMRLYEQTYQLLIHTCSFGLLQNNTHALSPILLLCLQTCIKLYDHYLPLLSKEEGRDREICQEFILNMMEHFTKEHSVSFYAKASGVTIQHFCSAIKRASGHTALKLINHFLIMNAKVQLCTTRKPIKEIAFELGFSTPSHFNRFFREHVGITPQQYRKNEE